MIAVIDNYDSFTWNLVDLLQRGTIPIEVYLNDAIEAATLLAKNPAAILISPGPGRPAQSGISPAVFAKMPLNMPFLGVCLGHQLLGEALGMDLVQGEAPVHGKTSLVYHDGKGLFEGMPNPFQAMRYHSLVLSSENLPDCLEICAWTADKTIMGLRHKSNPWHGFQFHPESILTEAGDLLLKNWLKTIF